MQPTQQRPPILQYLLLACIAALSLTHAFGGAELLYLNFFHGTTTVRAPFSSGYLQQTITSSTPEAEAAGLERFDTVLSVNGRPYTDLRVLNEQLRQMHAGDRLPVEFQRGAEATPRQAQIHLAAYLARSPTPWQVTLQLVFGVLPLLCLLIGLWSVLARPRSPHVWLILGILAYFDAIFVATPLLTGWVLPFAIVWNTIAQTAMPLCLMFFGVYFPQRSRVDRRLPWVKWLLATPILALFPLDLLHQYGLEWNFRAIHWLSPYLYGINAFENVVSFLAICWFFVTIGSSMQEAQGDALRRLRVLYYGATIGLTPFGILVLVAIGRKMDVGQNVPKWLDLSVFLLLMLFPLSLAYAVVVQRAVDVRILVRQGTKYLFARYTLRILLLALTVWMSILISRLTRTHGHQRNLDVLRIFLVIGLFFLFRFRLSKRLEQTLDQRFFREAYSSEQVLSELSEEARSYTEAQPLLETITDRIGATLHVERIAIFLRSGENFHLQLATGFPLRPEGWRMPMLLSSSATIRTLTSERSPASVYRDDPSSWLVDASDAERLALEDLSTELLVPLPGRNRLLGVMALGPKRSEEPYSRTDRQLLQTVGSQTGMALENAELIQTLTAETAQRERFSREIEIARDVQQRLFPQSYPEIPGVDMAGFCRPAQAVGGDYYDLFSLPRANEDGTTGGRLAIAVGDISGKGISASLLMASLRASLRSLSRVQGKSGRPDLADLMRNVNDLVFEASASNRYATFFFAELDVAARKLLYVNAGHNPPVILRGSATISLPPTGMVVGLLPEAEYEQAEIALEPGDTLLAFTDGVSEAMRTDEEEWGEERMIAAAHELLRETGCTYSAEQMIRCLMEQADAFTAGAPQHDDMTLLICRLSL